MKKLLVILAFFVSISAVSQTVKRIEVSGNIIVEGSDIIGITIFNVSTGIGTITDEKGEFKLNVALNDTIEVSALQYQNISFIVNKDIIESKKIKLFLIEEINKLDEIVVTKNKLSGNLKTDIKTTKLFKPKLDALYFGVKNNKDYNFENDAISKVDNISIDRQHKPMVNGLNIVNVVDQLLIPLFRSEVPNKEKVGVPDVPVESIKYYFGSEFLVDNFDIPKHRVEEFIRFVETENFDFTLLNYGKEIEFLELLNKKSTEFLTKN
ncbi:carboxypeptidase-like regulatory domain-containing protein [Jejuia spongiicola]|uniref:Carboxypeptidase-like regulatory domain-containing protein n=1 Tax=Jejuia spongiicola TaxID=2942207 RepID=A0ABT0QBB6_9FLAO|nr:carboxypeptidase-like regulatory domain-containing protein [Jejuia spongiicola]MCL6294216.1 carboxypeptidase-like regulatory domain-containing protein [Jejuia spongiicola]